MNLINKIFEKFQLSFIWKDNQRKVVKQTGSGFKLYQDENSVTNIFNIENVTVTKIEELAGIYPIPDQNMLLRNAGQRFLTEQATRQENLKTTVEKANLSAIESPNEVDKDWFLRWMEISQTISKDNIQDILARILSGEVRNSGAFSLRTLDILKNLSKQELQIFKALCDISYSIPLYGNSLTCVIVEPFGSPGNNGMLSLGLSYPNLTVLQDAGLIQTDLNAWRQFNIPEMLQIPFTIGSKSFVFKPTEKTNKEKFRVKIINFTSVGLELRSVLSIGINNDYNIKFIEWIKSRWEMIPS